MSIYGHSTDNHSFVTKCFSFCLSVFLTFCLSVFLYFYLFVFLSFIFFFLSFVTRCLSLFFCPSAFLSFCIYVFLPFSLFVSPFYLSVFLVFFLSCKLVEPPPPLPTSPMAYHVLIMPPKSPFTNQHYLCSMLFEKYICVCYFLLG